MYDAEKMIDCVYIKHSIQWLLMSSYCIYVIVSTIRYGEKPNRKLWNDWVHVSTLVS